MESVRLQIAESLSPEKRAINPPPIENDNTGEKATLAPGVLYYFTERWIRYRGMVYRLIGDEIVEKWREEVAPVVFLG